MYIKKKCNEMLVELFVEHNKEQYSRDFYYEFINDSLL